MGSTAVRHLKNRQEKLIYGKAGFVGSTNGTAASLLGCSAASSSNLHPPLLVNVRKCLSPAWEGVKSL